MKLRKAVRLATKNKCRLKNIELRMHQMGAKDLIYWLISAYDDKGKRLTNRVSLQTLKSWLESDKWELDLDE